MSKAEKFKKFCKKVWNLTIPVAIISVVIGAILIITKYHNKNKGAIETAKLTVPPSHNWEIANASFLGGLFLVILILVIVLYHRMKSKSRAVKPKISYKKIWNWIVPVVIISAIIGAILIVPKYYKGGTKSNNQVSAVFSWELDEDQPGSKRRSVPQNAVVIKNGDVFNFTVFYHHRGRKEVSIFKGEKDLNGKIEGTWQQFRPEDGGEWYLKQDTSNPRLYVGKYTDQSGDSVKMKLKILPLP